MQNQAPSKKQENDENGARQAHFEVHGLEDRPSSLF
jgi:hypothetical protein